VTTTWEVRVYGPDNDVDSIQTWTIENRTESEAVREATADVENEYHGMDWTLTEIKAELPCPNCGEPLTRVGNVGVYCHECDYREML